jgi:hypothetical protein
MLPVGMAGQTANFAQRTVWLARILFQVDPPTPSRPILENVRIFGCYYLCTLGLLAFKKTNVSCSREEQKSRSIIDRELFTAFVVLSWRKDFLSFKRPFLMDQTSGIV